MSATTDGDALIAIDVHGLAAGGDGVGKDAAGRTTFVAMTAPGDRARVRLVETHPRWARGELIELATVSAVRVDPPCPLFTSRRCGGCDWQHVGAAAQRDAKQAIVAAALRPLIAGGLVLEPLIAPEPDYGWRRRARWTIANGAIGYHGPRTKTVCDVDACPQLAPALEAVLRALRAHPRLLASDGELHAVIGAGGDAHVVIDARCRVDLAAGLVGQAGIAGVAWRDGAAGAATIELEPGVHVRADEFAQAGALGNAALRAEVAAAIAVTAGERVLELYAGGGNFTRDLIAAGATVTATDQHAPRVSAAPTARFVPGQVAEVVARLATVGQRFDAVLLDPPRTGARDVAALLAATGAARIVYVSCDPATFARDAALIVGSGYAAVRARGLDLMPQTAHVELVARFERRALTPA